MLKAQNSTWDWSDKHKASMFAQHLVSVFQPNDMSNLKHNTGISPSNFDLDTHTLQ